MAIEPSVQPAPPQAGELGATVPYERFLDCVHCGLCTAACPTYLERGDENDSPRGRIYLMRALVDGRLELDDQVLGHLDLCLDCRACETACPSGVQYGRLIEPFRVELRERLGVGRGARGLERWVIERLLPYRGRLRFALGLARLAQVSGLDWLLTCTRAERLLPRVLRAMRHQLPRFRFFTPRLPERIPAEGKQRATVALLSGCVADVVFRTTHHATARVLARNGCTVLVPREQACCGALAYHAGLLRAALPGMLRNVAVFSRIEADAIVVNVAGCGSTLKDYPHILREAEALTEGAEREAVRRALADAERMASKVRDITEFLYALGPVTPRGPIEMDAVYHDACHLAHAQGIRSEPRRLLEMVPGLRLVPLEEGEVCCGAAGTYALSEPEMSAALAARKAERIMQTGAHAVFTANAGCLIQIQRALQQRHYHAWVAHPIEALDLSYRELPPPLPQ